FQIDVGYPSAAEEVEIVQRTTAPAQETPAAVLGRDEILALQELVPRVPAAKHVIEHAVAIARASRPDQESKSTQSVPPLVRDYVAFGAGPRASQALILGAKARAVLDGRFAAEVEDVRALAAPVLRHRLVINFRAEAERVAPKDIIAAILEGVRP
ncbi:MAG: AAA family ATPase, partial [Deltaproteobacteria bacterium]|nr:AAA family ATPase [Deltaproteobacteria bacterium]